MNLILLIFITISIILSIILIILIISKRQKKLPDGSNLRQSDFFYKEKYQDTLKYLNAVYPQAEDSLKKLSYIDIAIFYNSLWYYYNCQSSFDHILNNNKSCWQSLPGCGTTYPNLPYTPQGNIYSFKEWIENDWTPWIKSDSTSDVSEIAGNYPGINLWQYFSGPAPLFLFQRIALRNVFSSKLPLIAYDANSKKDVNIPDIISGDIGSYNLEWNFPKNWYKGIDKYIEVTFTDALRGGAGAIIWWNGCPGTGIFVNLGKTKIARNKSHAAFKLAEEMAQTDKGKEKLKEWYYSDNPYDIVATLMMCKKQAYQIWDKNKNIKVDAPCYNADGTPNFKGIPTDKDGWNSVEKFSGMDWFQYCSNKVGDKNRDWAYNINNDAINNIMYGKNYYADRLNAQGCFDVDISIMGWYLGYDTIQMTYSSNGTGFWELEILELRNFPENVKNRDLSDFLVLENNNITWRIDNNGIIKNIIDKTMENLTLRDPLDINNDSKSKKCVLSYEWESNLDWTWNLTSKDNISNMYARLSTTGLDSKGYWNQCSPDGKGFNGMQMINKNSAPYG